MAIWTSGDLHRLIADHFSDHRFIVVSNREPYIHVNGENGVLCMRPASGLATALDPILRASGGVWVAHGSGDADRAAVDEWDRVRVPPEAPRYSLRRVWLTKQLEQEYYFGLANEGLWPLCHIAFQRPEFRPAYWESYREANSIFADAILDEAGDGPAIVFIQDYHFGLLPRMLKRRNPHITVAHFWHIPWPNRETFRAFPWKEELLDGMLGNDLLGFHLGYHCSNFLDTVDRNVESLVDADTSTILRNGHTTLVRPFPISIDYDRHCELAASAEVEELMNRWCIRIGGRTLWTALGVDRVDYTKGIVERIDAIDRLLELHPEYIGNLTFIQVGVPSRTAIGTYEELNRRIAAQIDAVNRKYSRRSWQPVYFIHRHLDQPDLMALHRLADCCVVTSLHDGMNLVAKEYVASRTDGDGVLVLSSFTGSARELTDALTVNPFAIDEIAEAMHVAFTMPSPERQRRMQRMRAVVESNNVYRWAGKLLQALGRIEIPLEVSRIPVEAA